LGFEAAWLAAREPYDDAALDRGAVEAIREWAGSLPDNRAAVVADLGSGTGVALRRVERWLAPRRIAAFAVDRDAALLGKAGPFSPRMTVAPLLGDVLAPLDSLGGPPDGTVDLVVGHALADLLPLDRLAARVAALLRPGGLAHLALTYDGLTAFEPPTTPDLDEQMLTAFHRQMDRPGRKAPQYGGSTAGRRLGPFLEVAGLEILADAPSVWEVCASDGPGGQDVLAGLIRFVLDATCTSRKAGPDDRATWLLARQADLSAGTLSARVWHRDVLARRPDRP